MRKANEWLGVATNVGVMVGLVLVAYQISQTNDSLELQRKQWATEYRWDRTDIFTDFWIGIAQDPDIADIWRRGNAGEELTEGEVYRYRLLASQVFWLQWNSHRNEQQRLNLLPPQAPDADGPLRILIRQKKRYPGIARELNRWLDESGLDEFRRELERVERNSE